MATQQEIDSVHATLDLLLSVRRFDHVNEMMQDIDVTCAETEIIVSYLKATLKDGPRLPYRSEFYVKAEKELKNRGYNQNLLQGLQGYSVNAK